MAYYLRVLTQNDKIIPISLIEDHLKTKNMEARFDYDRDADDDWKEVALSHLKGQKIAILERNEVKPQSLGEEEIEEFIEEIEDYKPVSAVKWLKQYLPKVKVIYAFQVLNGAYQKNGWEIIREAEGFVWSSLGGILQADYEGFSNEEGYHILWQFSDHVKGPWNMAVLEEGKWIKFQMDLGNKEQRETFYAGKVPEGVKRIRGLGI